MTDYSSAPEGANAFHKEVVASPADAKYQNVTKFLIVLDAHDGTVLANVTVGVGESIHFAMIIAGVNNDIFLGTSTGAVRVVAEV